MLMYSKDGVHLTQQFESLRLKAYPDAGGVPTIGWGHTAGVKLGDTCTAGQAIAWLYADLDSSVAAVNRLVSVALTQGEFDALVDFTYNLGAGSLENSTLLRLLNAGDYAAAASELEKWDYACGKQCAGLVRRRLGEQQLFDGAV